MENDAMTYYSMPTKRCTHRHRTLAGAEACARKLGAPISGIYMVRDSGQTVGRGLRG